jgi:uncharacterized protein (DUF1499 family)
MKTPMYWLIGMVCVLALLGIGVRFAPKGQPHVGLVDGRLSPCPKTPNCVCSESRASPSYIAPFEFAGTADSAWNRARRAIQTAGGTVNKDDRSYLWASFTTKWLHFVDDVELRLDADYHVIHVRSASRVGRSDFGANRKRVERLRMMLRGTSSDHADHIE